MTLSSSNLISAIGGRGLGSGGTGLGADLVWDLDAGLVQEVEVVRALLLVVAYRMVVRDGFDPVPQTLFRHVPFRWQRFDSVIQAESISGK